jgi:hypothetical protein
LIRERLATGGVVAIASLIDMTTREANEHGISSHCVVKAEED